MLNFWVKDYVRGDFGSAQDKKRNHNRIRRLYDLSVKDQYNIDDQTWNDLEMDDIFTGIDRTYSSAGEGALYRMLRTPEMDKEILEEREKIITEFSNNLDLTTKIRIILFNMGFDRKNVLLDMITQELVINKKKYYIYTLLGKILPIVWVLGAIIFAEPRLIILLMVNLFINIYFSQKEETVVRAKGLVYLKSLFTAAEKISKIKNDNIKSYTESISEQLSELKKIERGLTLIKFVKAFGELLDLFTMPLLLHETTYYNVSGNIKGNENKIFNLINTIGEVDALIGIASFTTSNKEKICKPEFTEGVSLDIKEGFHPLVQDAVPNSINIDKKGMVLTGTNMSGKSTFLRMIGSNILFAQTFNFAFAKSYKGSFFNVVTSISPKDDILNGKSYYMAEATSLLRVINSMNDDIPVFCAIDEIFRGTNPIERIASSIEILKYIINRNSVSIVTTHDYELTELLKGIYDFYYFSEEVDDKTGLKFDYKLKRGTSKSRNAIKLLEYIGYPKEITEGALKRAENNC